MTITQGERYYATASRNAGVQVELYRGEVTQVGKGIWERYKKGRRRRSRGRRQRERVREEITSWDYETIGATPMIRSLGMG